MNLAAVIINNDGEKYKVHTIAGSNDGSLHFIAGFNEQFKSSGLENLIPSKATFHQSGIKHFTSGQGEDRDELFRKKGISHKEISGSEGLITLSIKNVKKNCGKQLDKFTRFNKYKNIVELNTDNYTNLTLQYFLAEKNFDMSKSTHLYKEVFEIAFEDKKIIVGTNDSEDTNELLRVLLNR